MYDMSSYITQLFIDFIGTTTNNTEFATFVYNLVELLKSLEYNSESKFFSHQFNSSTLSTYSLQTMINLLEKHGFIDKRTISLTQKGKELLLFLHNIIYDI